MEWKDRMVLRSLLYRRKKFYEKPEPSLERAFLEGGREAFLAFCYSLINELSVPKYDLTYRR